MKNLKKIETHKLPMTGIIEKASGSMSKNFIDIKINSGIIKL